METKERELLRKIVLEVSACNQPDMLEGYLNGIGEQFNDELHELGLPTIDIIKEDE